MKPNSMTSAVSLVLAIALHSTASVAADEVYPGITCQAYYGTQAGDFNVGSYGIRNNSSGTRLISCPINRVYDYANNQTDAYRDVFVGYDSQSSPLTCFVYNMNLDGHIQNYGITTGAAGLDREMVITTNKRTDTHYQSLFCYLPGGAILDWYEPMKWYVR